MMTASRCTCSVDGCDRTCKGRGWCNVHLERWRRHGDPTITLAPTFGMPAVDRFWAKVNKTETCWLWTGATNGPGYGVVRADKLVLAHRFAYEQFVGAIPTGLHIDHLCRVRRCVNPDHLEPVTQRENNRRQAQHRSRSAA